MTTPLIIEDLKGNMFAVQTLVQEKEVLNNEKEIEFLLIENDETDKFIEEIQTGYKAHFRNNIYWIYNPVYEVVDDKVFVQCKAVHEFFPYFNGFYTQETWKDQSMTPADSILPLFDGKRFTVNMQSSLYAAVMNHERNVTYTERIMYALGRHDGEYQIDGTNFNIKHRIGTYRDDIILHPDINITDIKKEVESEGLSTWGKGFWQKKKDDEGSETEEYEKSTTAVHPLLSSIYGTEAKEGKAIYNDSVKHEETMKELIVASLDETFVLKYTMSIKEYDDPEKFRSIQLGDTLNAVIEKLDADIDLRVLEITRDWLNEDMKDMTITIGNGGSKAQYSNTSVDVLLEDVMLGKRPLPPSAYDEGVRRATALINGDLNGNFQYMPDGVYGQDPDNPNHRTRYSIAGLAYMTDGRQWNNALTYRGLTASAIYTGTLRADLIEILGAEGNYRATGGVSTWTNPNDSNKFVRVDPQGLHINKGAFNLTGFDEREFIVDGIMRGEQVANIQRFNLESMVPYNGRDMLISSEDYHPCYVIWDTFKGRYLDLTGTARLGSTGASEWRYVDIEITEVGSNKLVATLRKQAHKTTDPGVYSWDLRIDIQEFFGTVVDYRRIFFYVNFRIVNPYDSNTAHMRLNQGGFYG